MPRQARKKSESGIYHVMLRGINRQQIFEVEEDFQKFISVLKDCKAISEFKLFAYCHRGNHIHLLSNQKKKRLNWFSNESVVNMSIGIIGSTLEKGIYFKIVIKVSRLTMKVIFLTVLRHIHQNPIKANLCKTIAEYEYSSYREYELKNSTLIDTDFAVSITDKKSC